MYELIDRQSLTAAASSITFSSLPQTYTDLVLVFSGRSARAATFEEFRIFFNGSNTSLTTRYLEGDGSSVVSGAPSNGFIGIGNSTASSLNAFSSSTIYIPNYAGSTIKTFSVDSVGETNSSTSYQDIVAGVWNSTAPITSITLTNGTGSNWSQNTSATLYGIGRTSIMGRGTKPKAIGGNVSYMNGYWIHTFTGSGTFSPGQNLSVDTLIVAGGGGGGTPGASRCGGGGAGGVIQTTSSAITGGVSYDVVVGGGGAIAGTGSNSSFNGLVAYGGGFGASNVSQAGGNGGSGGGGNRVGMSGGLAIAGQGYRGGYGSTASGSSDTGGGGGGGAGGMGNHYANNAFTNEPAGGGPGIQSSISGISQWYAEGGAGSGYYDRGTYNQNLGGNVSGSGHIAGTVYTGSGGGGGKDGTAGGAGGSGIVIIRYPA